MKLLVEDLDDFFNVGVAKAGATLKVLMLFIDFIEVMFVIFDFVVGVSLVVFVNGVVDDFFGVMDI